MSETTDLQLPDHFRARLLSAWGAQAAAWLAGLPRLLDTYCARWAITLGPPFELSYNYVAPATRADGSPAVLKAGVPNRELVTEIAALEHYAGDGAVRLLEADGEGGVMLLERIEPGDMLLALEDDDERTRIAAGVMRHLFRPPPVGHAFPTIAGWSRAFERLRARHDGGTGPLPPALVEQAEAIVREETGAPEPVLLHGDLHHGNILRASRQPWLAIDPKGVIGDPACEAGSLLFNPLAQHMTQSEVVRLLPRRLDILSSELGIGRERLRRWSLHKAVLSACWTVEDGDGNAAWTIAVAQALATLKP